MSLAAVLGSILLLSVLSIAIAVVSLRLRYGYYMRRLGEEVPRLGIGGSVRYLAGVAGSFLKTAWWRVRAAGGDGWSGPIDEMAGPPVLCVHGFLASGTCFRGLRRSLESAGRPTVAVTMGLPLRSIDAYVPPLRRALESLRESAPAGSFDVVAHSMGGIALRRVLAQDPLLAEPIRRIVTLGTPHQGTPVSRLLPKAPEVAQMSIGSDYLRRLPDFGVSAPEASVVSVAAHPDLLVFPVAATRLPGARAVTLNGVSHLGLLTETSSIDTVVELLRE